MTATRLGPPPGAHAEIAVIGGTGFYDLAGLEGTEQVEVTTPWGAASSPIILGRLHGRPVAFISRHGPGHSILPSELPARANIWALKSLGVRQVLAISAVGSLREGVEPLHAVVPNQLLDRTRGRPATFFGDGLVGHISFADPFDRMLGAELARAARQAGVTTHPGGTLVVIDGPAFSTRAESQLYRSWGATIIGMTALPEAKLAREAELCYGSLCLVTDYDTWHESEADVSSTVVLRHLRQNAASALDAISHTISRLGEPPDCECRSALDGALVTARELVPESTRRRLWPILERSWGPLTTRGAS